MDMAAYVRRSRTGPCFVCALVSERDGRSASSRAAEQGYEHEVVLDDGEHIAFLSRYPTVYGYLLVAPKRHVEHVFRDLTPLEYGRLWTVVHRVARALESVVPSERTYVLSLGSQQGNPHVHIHVVPLPPGTPYEQQQFHALMTENGVVPLTAAETAALGAALRAALTEALASARELAERPCD
jgi:histidine triad (HIT) family protein/ATP adenylyltransferase